jgi:hypothetical protein
MPRGSAKQVGGNAPARRLSLHWAKDFTKVCQLYFLRSLRNGAFLPSHKMTRAHLARARLVHSTTPPFWLVVGEQVVSDVKTLLP